MKSKAKDIRRLGFTRPRKDNKVKTDFGSMLGGGQNVALRRTARTFLLRPLGLLAATLMAEPALAMRDDVASWRAYLRGRAAISGDRLDEAATQFQAALQSSADNRLLRQRTFGLALLSGNEELASDLAQRLKAEGVSGFDSRLMLLVNAIKKRRWKDADALRVSMQEDNQLGFALPVMEAWIARGERRKDPLAPISTIGRDVLANSYAAEHRAYLLGATGRTDEALTEYAPLIAGGSGRAVRIRLAAAAMLQREGRKDEALEMLAGGDPTLIRGRAMVRAGKKLPTGVATPADGIAELFVRLAADVGRDHFSEAGMLLARVSTFLAPENAETWLVTADMLAGDGKPAAALRAVEQIPPDDPFADQAAALRISLLLELDRKAEALGIAQALASRPGASGTDWAQLGDVLNAADQKAEAAKAYGKAIEMTVDPDRLWRLYLVRGGIYERMGNWEQAEPDLRKTVAMAPDQAVALNYLGYALLDRNRNLDEAQRLIEKASALKPADGAIADSLAWVHYRRGDYKRAVTLLEKAVQLEPAEPTINEHLGDAYWRAGRLFEARFSWRAALVGAEESAVLERLRGKIDFGLESGDAAP